MIIYAVYGQTSQRYALGDLDYALYGVFESRKDAENFMITFARKSFDYYDKKTTYSPCRRLCEYNHAGELLQIHGDNFDNAQTDMRIREIAYDSNSRSAWLIMGTVDAEQFPEHEPFSSAYDNPVTASTAMLREAFFSIDDLGIPNNDIVYSNSRNYPDDFVSKIYDGENYKVELRLVKMPIR